MRVENPDLYHLRLTRRQALVGGLSALVYAGVMVYDKVIFPKFLFSAPETEDLKTNSVSAGVIAVHKGVNIRTSPHIPDSNRFRKPDNTLPWGQIEAVNGIPLESSQVFLILNPEIVRGQSGYEDSGFYWMKLLIKKKGGDKEWPYYVNLSRNTSEHVKFLGYAGFADHGEQNYELYGSRYMVGKWNLDEGDIGRVIILNNPNTMVRDIMPVLWSERMRKKFQGEVSTEEKMVENLQVVAAGSDQEVEEMIRMRTPINVREYPSLEYGNGVPVHIAGKILQGTVISKALIPPDDFQHFHFTAVKSEDIQGELLDDRGNLFVPVPGKVYAISSIYLSAA